MRIVVLGGSGFVGSAVVRSLRERAHDVEVVASPRVAPAPGLTAEGVVRTYAEAIEALAERFRGADAVICASGVPDATSRDNNGLVAANAASPALAAAAAHHVGVARFVYVSSAAVQGAGVLDDSETYDAFSPYAASKIEGERWVRRTAPGSSVCYRPPGVHSATRSVSRRIAAFARSPLASVAGAGDAPTPQALVENVASALCHLVEFPTSPPTIVHHPWEGVTVEALLVSLSGLSKRPHHLPTNAARFVVRALTLAGQRVAPIAPQARRLEIMWFGQSQAPSWFSATGWAPVAGDSAWRDLGQSLIPTGGPA